MIDLKEVFGSSCFVSLPPDLVQSCAARNLKVFGMVDKVQLRLIFNKLGIAYVN